MEYVTIGGRCKEYQAGTTYLQIVTAAEKPGMQAYQRSAKLILLKAFYETVGKERIEKLSVDFSVGKGLFVNEY